MSYQDSIVIIDSLQKIIMEELKCPVCKSQYSETNPPRLLTMCGHTYCHQCIKTFIKRKEYRYQIKCPEDKLKLNLDSPTPSHFPRNMIVIQAMNRLRPKVEMGQDKNQFLVGAFSEGAKGMISRSSLKSTQALSKRSSVDEGRCLLHQKPLDIICLQEKTQICAECALFGIHKGHTCTTIKDLQAKRMHWIHQLAQIMQERKNLQQKMDQKVLANSFSQLLQKKRTQIFQQIQSHFSKLKQILQEHEFQLKEQVSKELNLFQSKMNENVGISPVGQKMFKEWQKQVLNSMQYLQADDLIKQIAFFSQMMLSQDQNLVSKGRSILDQLKQDQQTYWSALQSNFQFPKISYSQCIQIDLRKAIQVIGLPKQQTVPESNKETKQQVDGKTVDLKTSVQEYQTPQFQEISLLDFTDNFKYKFNLSTLNDTHIENDESNILIDNSFLPNINSSCSMDIHPSTIKKVKSKDSLLNTSLNKTISKRNLFNSPKHRNKTQFTSKGTLPPPSPVFLKGKAKRNTLKAKDPQKFQKIINALEADSLQIADFTGLQMGDQLGKEVCDKLKKCTKVRSLRLMKNQLTDEILSDLFEVITHLQIINLSQNAFSANIFQHLERQAKKGKPNTVKYFQLGQNNINSRKFKDRIEELKRLGYIVSL